MAQNENDTVPPVNIFLDKIEKCISETYCCAKELKCIGKSVREANLKLKKLLLAKYLAENGEGNALLCFLGMPKQDDIPIEPVDLEGLQYELNIEL